MTTPLGSAATADSESRWRAWQARGAAADRLTASRMRILMIVIAAGFAVVILSRML
jgi:hypothetical protein